MYFSSVNMSAIFNSLVYIEIFKLWTKFDNEGKAADLIYVILKEFPGYSKNSFYKWYFTDALLKTAQQ